jgi:pimeloyl-ACP methyl ester carboxylesterase
MAVMRFHPEIVQRAVMRGMEGPDHTYDMPTGFLNVLKRVSAEAENAPNLKNLIPEGGLIEALKTVIDRVEKEPVRVDVADPVTGKARTVVFTARDVRRVALGYSGGLTSWPADVLTLYAGDFSKMAKKAAERSHERSFRTASFFMLDCGSGISPEREAALNEDPAAEIVGNTGWYYQMSCPVWNSDLGDAFRQNFESDIPTVIVHGDWDTSTPLENALELAPFFKNSKLIVVKRGSHSAIRNAMSASEAFRESLMKFAETGDMSDLPDEVTMPPVEWTVPPIR